MTLYRDLIAKGLSLSWRHKFLWLLALFAALAGTGGEFEFFFSGSDSINGQSAILGFARAFYADGTLPDILGNVQASFQRYPVPSLLVALLIVLLFLLIVWFIIIAQAALVWALGRLQNQQPVGSKMAFSNGLNYFSPIFIINLLAKAIIIGVMLVIAVPLGVAYIRTGNILYNNLYIVTAFVALVPIAIILSFILKYVSIYVVLRGQPWSVALKNGWRLFTRNWLTSLEVSLTLFGLNLLSFFLLILFLLLLGLGTTGASMAIFLLILTLWGIYMTSFQYSVWVSLFFELENGHVRSKLLRWSDALTKRWTAPVNKIQ